MQDEQDTSKDELNRYRTSRIGCRMSRIGLMSRIGCRMRRIGRRTSRIDTGQAVKTAG